jgi:hypothetical protein
MASAFILQESKIAENKTKILKNDEEQTQKLKQGSIIKKVSIFHQNLDSFDKVFLVLKKVEELLFFGRLYRVQLTLT